MTSIFVPLVILAVSFIGIEQNSRRSASEEAQACIEMMFSDADAFDPGSHFEVTSEFAPPFDDAIDWINPRMADCMSDFEAWEELHGSWRRHHASE